MVLNNLHPGLYEEMKRNSLDPYIAIRQAFLEYRRNKVLDRDVRNNAFREEQ
jgi:ABC-type transporter lipoprotein component MlaA